jgi:hypothetical protein
MSESNEKETFATWWQPLTRREFAGGTLAVAAVATFATTQSGCCLCAPSRKKSEPSDTEAVEDSLKLQKENGWNIGQESKPLVLPGATDADSKGSPGWRAYLKPEVLIQAVSPASPDWQPFFVPTLIQALGQASLASKMTPIYDEGMAEAKARGEAIAKTLLPATEKANTTLIVVDMPGRRAVAMAAGLADTANVVFTFDNWPHPIGVVKSQETLGALLYFAAELAEKKAALKPDAPTAIILDSTRLTPFTNPDTQFDNRYIAKMPEPAQLKAKGITNVLYVTPDRTRQRELDDLNELFVDYKKADMQVAVLPATDLQRSAEPVKKTVQTEAGPREVVTYNYYYGGYPHTHFYFFTYYPFWVYRPAYMVRTGIVYRGAMRPPMFSRPIYAPVARPTAFAGYRMGARGGIGRARPSGFGRTSVRMSGGRITGVRAGHSGGWGRGSYGRGGSRGGWGRGFSG